MAREGERCVSREARRESKMFGKIAHVLSQLSCTLKDAGKERRKADGVSQPLSSLNAKEQRRQET